MKTKLETATDIFACIFTGDRDSKSHALTLLSQLSHDQRQELAECCQTLDKLIQEFWRASTFRAVTPTE